MDVELDQSAVSPNCTKKPTISSSTKSEIVAEENGADEVNDSESPDPSETNQNNIMDQSNDNRNEENEQEEDIEKSDASSEEEELEEKSSRKKRTSNKISYREVDELDTEHTPKKKTPKKKNKSPKAGDKKQKKESKKEMERIGIDVSHYKINPKSKYKIKGFKSYQVINSGFYRFYFFYDKVRCLGTYRTSEQYETAIEMLFSKLYEKPLAEEEDVNNIVNDIRQSLRGDVGRALPKKRTPSKKIIVHESNDESSEDEKSENEKSENEKESINKIDVSKYNQNPNSKFKLRSISLNSRQKSQAIRFVYDKRR